MLLSIITINFNNLIGLQRTYDSVVCQSFMDYEWIIIDGGSTDGSTDYITKIARDIHANPFLSYWCSEPDKGIYDALNKGVTHCHGKYVSCMNAGDCFYDSETLSRVFHSNRNADVLYGDALFVEDDKGKSAMKLFPKKLTLNWLYHHSLNHQATFVKRNLLEKYRFDEKYHIMADRKLWLQFYLDHCSFQYLNQPIARYDKTGISSRNGELWIDELKQVRKEVLPGILIRSRVARKIYSFMFGV